MRLVANRHFFILRNSVSIKVEKLFLMLTDLGNILSEAACRQVCVPVDAGGGIPGVFLSVCISQRDCQGVTATCRNEGRSVFHRVRKKNTHFFLKRKFLFTFSWRTPSEGAMRYEQGIISRQCFQKWRRGAHFMWLWINIFIWIITHLFLSFLFPIFL